MAPKKNRNKKKPVPAREVCRPRSLRVPAPELVPVPVFSRTKLLIIAAILTLLALSTYSNTFSTPFLQDGVPSIRDNPHIRSLWPIWDAMKAPNPSTLSGRPIASLSFALNYKISGPNVWSYHLFNIIFHLLSALLLFGIVRRTLLTDPLKQKLSKPSEILALFTAAIWLVHPLHTTAVTYLVQRTESLMGLFYLLTVYCAVRAFTAEKKTRWYALSILACILGVCTKESTITAPLVILIYDRIFISRSFKELLAARWWYHLLLFSTWVIVITLVFTGSRRLAPFTGGVEAMTQWQYFITQFEVMTAVYLKLSFWPHPLIFDYGAPFKESFSQVIPYALFIFLLLAATILALFKKPPAAFLGVWFFGNLVLTSSFINLISESIAERRMYLSLAAVAAGTVIGAYLLLKRLRQNPKIGAAPAGIVVVVLCILTFVRNSDYKTTQSIWEDTVEKRPQNARAWVNLGNEYVRQGEHQKAASAFGGAAKANPGYAEAYLNRATANAHLRRFDRALEDLDRALKRNPDLAHAFRIRGSIHGILKNYDQAVSDLTRAIELNPEDAGAHLDRGTAYERLGDPRRAVEDFEKTLDLDPKNVRARRKLESARSKLRDQ